MGAVVEGWLLAFNDEQLTAAVNEAIAHNADLRVGATRVEQALLQARLAGARLYPSVDLLARGGGKLSGDGSGIQGGVLTASWELDLWARVRSGRAASAAQAASAQADYVYARESIAALVAKSWILATELGLQADEARDTIRANEELVRLADDRARIGVGNQADVYSARAIVGGYRDTVASTGIGPCGCDCGRWNCCWGVIRQRRQWSRPGCPPIPARCRRGCRPNSSSGARM